MATEAFETVDRFEQAVRADTFKGGGHPDDIPDIEKEYKESKEALFKYIQILKKYRDQIRFTVKFPSDTQDIRGGK